MSEVVLGKIIKGEAFKDAIHIAIYPVVAGENMSPGDTISLTSDKKAVKYGKRLGIVDPFLDRDVLPGQKFYMFLFPNTVKGMRHEWSHPSFIDENTDLKQESVIWIQNFAKECGISYSDIMDSAKELLERGSTSFYGDDTPEIFRYRQREFWYHHQVVTGIPIPDNMDDFYFRCAC